MSLPTICESTSSSFDPLVLDCESFINDRLKADLMVINRREEAIHVQLNNYQDLRAFLRQVLDGNFGNNKPIKSQFDLGCNFYVRCTIPQANKIILFVGLGLYMEFSYNEALKFIEKRCEYLNGCLDKLSDQACAIKAHIKVTLETLGYIQQLKAPEENNLE